MLESAGRKLWPVTALKMREISFSWLFSFISLDIGTCPMPSASSSPGVGCACSSLLAEDPIDPLFVSVGSDTKVSTAASVNVGGPGHFAADTI